MHKASKKKREKSSAKKERKATKTLAIVLGKLKLHRYCSFILFLSGDLDADIRQEICGKLTENRLG